MSDELPGGPEEGTTEPASQWLGRVVDGRYRITRLLGVGGMGEVFEAQQLNLDKPVALKIVHSEFTDNGEVAARFSREAMATARLEHPHVASALDFGVLDDGTTYLVMQLVRGESLAAEMWRGPMPWQRACEIAAQVADGLAAAHREGIIHRDLKPDNVMLSRRDDDADHVRVLDFGVARVPVEAASAPKSAAPERALTKIGTVVGTPGYMSPEQALGEPIDGRADIYTLGILLWEMLTGNELYPEEDLSKIVARQLQEPPPRIASAPAGVQALLDRLLSSRADERPANAKETRDALRRLVAEGAAFDAGEEGRETASLEAARSKPDSGHVTVPERPSVKPTRGSTFLGRLAVIAALLVAVLALTYRRSEPEVDGSSAALDEALEHDVRRAMNAEGYARRKAAAERLLAHRPEDDLPPYAITIAELALSEGCADRRAAIAELIELDDPRALPAIRRLQHMPSDGCGPNRDQDCYECLRDPLLRAANQLRATRDARAAR